MARNSEIAFNENDPVGETTLTVISEAHQFNNWMYQTIKPFIKGNVLEIGSGIGNISKLVLNDGYNLMLSDIRQVYCNKLIKEFEGHQNYSGIIQMDLTDSNFEEKFKSHLRKYDTVFALNVVEHIKNDSLALQNCHKLLKDSGHLIILVPSYQKLYNKFDEQLGHYKRYNKSTLSKLFKENKICIIHKQYFNFTGIFGWYITGSLFKKDAIPGGQMKLYNAMVPIFKVVDKIIFNRMGLSTIIIGKKA
ncbi:class I SAM-dependent methyltransferase [Paucihalobacter ruber]|uniref:Class I SAM-dependent methyltransferase n=1 Tax=Paucihalobacter ruber TaxID=2567861 RepID=A0A506PK23_9FLAO|nr:methyltransferase domain-containing protein [Paucihalobacter ruber]TPV33858.1 class I SAM-dependent methyltransferase [Paucihalobacter ruber]